MASACTVKSPAKQDLGGQWTASPGRAGGLHGVVPRAGLQAQRFTQPTRHTLGALPQALAECLTEGPRDVFCPYADFSDKEQDTKIK